MNWRTRSGNVNRSTTLTLVALFGLGGSVAAQQHAERHIQLSIIGGLGGVTQFTKIEQPFWQMEISRLSNGRVNATIRPIDEGGFRT